MTAVSAVVNAEDGASPTPGDGAAPPTGRRPVLPAAIRGAKLALWLLVTLGVMVGLWELYKFLGGLTDGRIPLVGWDLPVSPTDSSMPHVHDIVRALFHPATRGNPELLITYLVGEAWVTLRESLIGLVLGAAIGFALSVLFVNWSTASRAVMPWLIASQTVPLVAIAPMVVVWGGRLSLPSWVAVTGISAYLAFFPVTVNATRGMLSPPSEQAEMMRSVAAGRLQTLWLLRVPAGLPYLFAGLRLAATASVVGAIVGELSAGTGRGIGRSILTFAYFYGQGPEKLFAAVIVAAFCGIALVQGLAALEAYALRHRPKASRS